MIKFLYETASWEEAEASYNESTKEFRYVKDGNEVFRMDVEELNYLFGILAMASDATTDICPTVPDNKAS